MPRVTRPLSTTEIKAAKPREKDYSLCDGGGLEICIKANSARAMADDLSKAVIHLVEDAL